MHIWRGCQGLRCKRVLGNRELTTPFWIDITTLANLCLKQNGKIILSDDGYILSNLPSSGLEVVTRNASRVAIDFKQVLVSRQTVSVYL